MHLHESRLHMDISRRDVGQRPGPESGDQCVEWRDARHRPAAAQPVHTDESRLHVGLSVGGSAMTTTLGPPPAVTATPPGSAVSRTWRTIAIFLPSPIREASKQGLLRTLVYLMLAITVFPLLVAFLAAFWLSTIK